MNTTPLARDFVSYHTFPAVIQSADVRALREAAAHEPDAAVLEDFCGGYLGYDDRARHALECSLQALRGAGGAFFFNGVFGSGKSHLLGLLALLADGAGWEHFLRSHPHLRAMQPLPARLVVHFSLDDWSAAQHSLESICWREIEAEWRRRFGETLPLAPKGAVPAGTRSDAFAALVELCAERGLAGCALFMDELSLFLGGREHHALQQDAAWLQFLGQRARRHGAGFFAVFAALQKTVEDIGDLDGYAISQIRDRFSTLPLSLAHLPSLIERRLVTRHDAAGLQLLNHRCYDRLAAALPRLDFGRDEWDRAFPFHPATVALLEQIAPRYFSRTRSAALFCQKAADVDAPVSQRVLPPALFDDIVDELPLHPDLKPIHNAWLQWQKTEAEAARDGAEAAHLRDCFKLLALWRIAGGAPTVAQMVNALMLPSGLSGDAAYEYGRITLEKLRANAPVALERRDGEFQDRYSLDFGTRVPELARRFTGNALANFAPRDGRVARYVLSCSRDEALPLASLDGTTAAPMWRNAVRRVPVFVSEAPPAPEVLANRIAALAAPGGADWLLLLGLPFGTTDAARWREAVREALTQATVEARWNGAVVWWLPREASADEWAQAREGAAQHGLLHDPQLSDNRRGRAVLEHLKAGLAERETQLGRIAVRLLFEGTLANGAGAVIDGGELASGTGWGATLEALADWTLPSVFPQWPGIAPRARVLTESSAQTLGLEVLRRPATAPFFAPSHERLVRAIAEPLGVARADAGRWRIEAPHEKLRAFLTGIIADDAPMTLTALEAQAAKSEWGLAPELTRLCVCALLRSGEVTALDTRGAAVAPDEIGFPLARSIRALQPGQLMSDAEWENVRHACGRLGAVDPGTLSYSAQQDARAALQGAVEEWRASAELFAARLHQLRRALGGHWRQCDGTWEDISKLLHALGEDPLASAARMDEGAWTRALDGFRTWNDLLEARAADTVEAQLFLAHPQLAAPQALRPAREVMLARLGEGEAALVDEGLSQQVAVWRAEYERAYAAWHREQNDAARLQPLRKLTSGDALRALEAWDTLAGGDKLAPPIRAALQEEGARLCPRDGSVAREPVCATCRLRLGERVELDTAPIEAQFASAQVAIREWLGLLREAASPALSPLFEWLDAAGSLDALWPLLTESALRELNAAMRPAPHATALPLAAAVNGSARRRVTRSFASLRASIRSCRTRADAERAFGQWLDEGGVLGSEDGIEWTD